MRSTPTVCCNPFPGHGVKVAPMFRPDRPGFGGLKGVYDARTEKRQRANEVPVEANWGLDLGTDCGRVAAMRSAPSAGVVVCDEATLSPLRSGSSCRAKQCVPKASRLYPNRREALRRDVIVNPAAEEAHQPRAVAWTVREARSRWSEQLRALRLDEC
jgi:hypothetical protein